jgi:hypothetical protein
MSRPHSGVGGPPVYFQLLSELGPPFFLLLIAFVQTVLWVGLVFVPVGFYRRRQSALTRPRET